MLKTKKQFLDSMNYEASLTLNVLSKLTDESLTQQITPENWNLGRLAWHIVTAIQNLGSQTGLIFEAPTDDSPVPKSAEIIVASYEKAIAAFAHEIETKWTEENLIEERNFFGRQMTNGQLLLLLLQHQIHHRGQMTVLMRQAGLTVPGVYGPSKEEWEQLSTN